MIRVPFYVFVILLFAALMKKLPIWFPDSRKKLSRLLLLLYFAAGMFITLLSRVLYRVAVRLYHEAHPELSHAAWIPDPSDPVILGAAGSSWLAEKQGIRGLHWLWIALSDPNSRWSIVPSCMLNVLFFMPLGILLPCVFPKLREKKRYCVWIGFAGSLAIELAQLVTGLGQFDVLDLICNTLGVSLGWMIWQKNLSASWEEHP